MQMKLPRYYLTLLRENCYYSIKKHSEEKTSQYITLPKFNVCINKRYSFCLCFLKPLFAILSGNIISSHVNNLWAWPKWETENSCPYYVLLANSFVLTLYDHLKAKHRLEMFKILDHISITSLSDRRFELAKSIVF